MIPGVAQTVVETVLTQERAAMERWRHEDPEGWLDISADHITYVDPRLARPLHGMEAYRDHLQSLLGTSPCDESELVDPRVAVYGKMAVLTYNYLESAPPTHGGASRWTSWNSTKVYACLGGQWKNVHIHWSYVGEQRPNACDLPRQGRPTSPDVGGPLAEVLTLEQAALDRWRRGDPWGFAEMSTDEVTYFGPGTPWRINGLQALKTEYGKREGRAHYDVVELVEPQVHLHGPAVVLTYRCVAAMFRADGTAGAGTPWNCTEVFVRRQGAWKIVHTHRSYVLGRRR